MAKTVSVVIFDDIDGSERAETLTFALQGVTYEIDLGDKNRAKLEKAFAPYIEHGRRVTARPRRSGAPSVTSRVDRAAVRAWAREQGLTVSERGRISAEILHQYEAAN